MSPGYWLGVDLGGTKILAGLFDDELKLLARSKQPTAPESGPPGVVANLVKAVEAVMREANLDPSQICGMGIGVPGQIELGTTFFNSSCRWGGFVEPPPGKSRTLAYASGSTLASSISVISEITETTERDGSDSWSLA